MAYSPVIIALKLLDLFLLTIYYFTSGFYISALIDWIAGPFDKQEESKKSTLRLFIESVLYTFVLIVIFYIVRNLISRIPFPFEGAYGFKHDLVKEREGDVIFVFILFLYQEYYVNKLTYLYDRITNTVNLTD
uniref:Uncharacterized protein n=1 Tax=viral metagenome TaxID=1070528 RepID=A0A6C0DFN5_9ZZZZ